MRYLIALLLAACSSSSGVVRTGEDSYMIAGKNTAIGASGHETAAEVYREAAAFCESQGGKVMKEIKSETRGPGFARFPSARVDFRCVSR